MPSDETFQVHGSAVVRKQRFTRKNPGPVISTQVTGACLVEATLVADGNSERLEIVDANTIIVWNTHEHRKQMRGRT